MTKLVHSLYDMLGVSRFATRAEIVDAERVLQTGRAQTLLDDSKRAAYDRDFEALARSYADVAHALPVDHLGKLEVLADWLGDGAGATASEDLAQWAAHDPLLDGDAR
jgi:hypothetical protein